MSGPVHLPAAWVLLLISLTSSGMLACASGPAPRDHFYRLAAAPPPDRLAAPVLQGVLEVERMQASALARGRPLLRSAGADAVEVTPYRYHLWVDSPTTLVQRALADWLRARGLATQIVTPEMHVSSDYLLTGRIDRLEYVPAAGHVLLELELSLAVADHGRLLHRATYRVQAPTAGGEPSDAARALGAALGQAFAQFTADITDASGTSGETNGETSGDVPSVVEAD